MFDKGRQLFWTANAFHLFNVWWWNRVSKRWAKLATAYIRSKTPPLSFLKSFFFGFPSQLVPFFFESKERKWWGKRSTPFLVCLMSLNIRGGKEKREREATPIFVCCFFFKRDCIRHWDREGNTQKMTGVFQCEIKEVAAVSAIFK